MTVPTTLAQKKKRGFITCLKFIACLLILNSHCRDIYPIYFLAVGGGHGNAIFFALSGYCLANIKLDFQNWYIKRLRRILPVTFVVLITGLAFSIFTQRLSPNPAAIFHDLINRYWFVWAIFIYYIVFYFIIHTGHAKKTTFCLAVFVIGYAVLYALLYSENTFFIELEGFSPFKVYFYFGIMLTGGLLRQMGDNLIQYAEKVSSFAFTGLILVSGFVWVCEYASIFVFNNLHILQFLIHLSIFSFIIFTIPFAQKLDKHIHKSSPIYRLLMEPIANSTLEIYLVQVTFKALAMYWEFPTNWVLFISGSIILGNLIQTCRNINFTHSE